MSNAVIPLLLRNQLYNVDMHGYGLGRYGIWVDMRQKFVVILELKWAENTVLHVDEECENVMEYGLLHDG